MWWPLWPRLVEEPGKGGFGATGYLWFIGSSSVWHSGRRLFLAYVLVAGLFYDMISKAHLKSHRRNSESMQPDVVTSALLQAHCSSASTLRPILKSIREKCERERGRENVQREQVRPSVTIDLVSRERLRARKMNQGSSRAK